MSITGFLRSHWIRFVRNRHRRLALRDASPLPVSPDTWPKSLEDPTAYYLRAFAAFHRLLPAELRAHRAYFHDEPANRRGYGEDAFHTLWYVLMNEFRPANYLEIGIFRGQTVTLAALCARLGKFPCAVHGISPFSSAGDSVSSYRKDIDYYTDTLSNFDRFQLPHPTLLRAYSTDPQAVALIQSRTWDMIYIDGNHDYEVVRQDWDVCSKALKAGGVVVLDDSGLSTRYQPPIFATRGHPGPSRIAEEIDRGRFREILQVGHNRAFQKLS